MAIGRSTLNYDQLNTVLVKVETIVNSRPLTYVYDHVEGVSYSISPSHLLYVRQIISLPNSEVFETYVYDDVEGVSYSISPSHLLYVRQIISLPNSEVFETYVYDDVEGVSYSISPSHLLYVRQIISLLNSQVFEVTSTHDSLVKKSKQHRHTLKSIPVTLEENVPDKPQRVSSCQETSNQRGRNSSWRCCNPQKRFH